MGDHIGVNRLFGFGRVSCDRGKIDLRKFGT